MESPAGIPWEQEALVIVGGEDREREKGAEVGQRGYGQGHLVGLGWGW